MFETKFQLYEYFLSCEDVFALFCHQVSRLKLSAEEKQLLDWAQKFRRDMNRMPNRQEIALRVGRVILDEPLEDAVLHREFLDVVKNERMKDFIIETSEMIDRRMLKLEEVFDRARSIVEDFAGSEKRFIPFKDQIPHIAQRMLNPKEGDPVSTGIANLDKILHGGPRRGEVMITIAPPSRGKTMWLVNQTYGALVAGNKVLFITNELSEEAISGRIFRRIAKMSRKEVRVNLEEAVRLGNLFVNNCGDFSVMYTKAHMLSLSELGAMIDRFKRTFGGIDLVVIDYFDRLKLPHKDARLGYGQLVDGLRELGSEKEFSVATATQANRASLSAVVVTEEYIGESFKKVESADIVISINRSEADEKKNAGRLVVLKNREFGGRGAQIPIHMNWEQSLMKDFGK